MPEEEIVLHKKQFRHKLISLTIYATGSNPFLLLLLQNPVSLATETIALTRKEVEQLYDFLKEELENR